MVANLFMGWQTLKGSNELCMMVTKEGVSCTAVESL